jgi:hypothetical protein
MGFLNSMAEAFSLGGQVSVKGEIPEMKGLKEQSDLWELLSLMRKVQTDRRDLFELYTRMSKDSLVSSAIEMIVEDATQYDQVKNKIVWIKCDNEDIQNMLNEYLDEELKIEERLFCWGYNIVTYGEHILQTHFSDHRDLLRKRNIYELAQKVHGDQPLNEAESRSLLEEYSFEDLENAQPLTEDEQFALARNEDVCLEDVSDPTHVLDMTYLGRTVGYFVEDERNKGKGTLCPPEDYIHFISDRGHNRQDYSITYTKRNSKGEEALEKKFVVKYGTSFLKGATQAWQVVSLLEDVMALARLSRSSFFRIFGINVGSAGKMETVKIVQEVRNLIKSRERINLDTGYYKSDINPVAMGDAIFVPTRNGKGDIKIDTVGGDLEVSKIVDFEYFHNKLCGALRTPKAFLGFEESLPGGIGNTSLTRLDIRYARTVKRLVTCLKNGIRDILNHYLMRKGREEAINTFEVVMSHINDAEESDRVADFGTKAQALGDFLTLLASINDVPPEVASREKLLVWAFDKVGESYGTFKPTPEEIAKAKADLMGGEPGGGVSPPTGASAPGGGGGMGPSPSGSSSEGPSGGGSMEVSPNEIPSSPDLSKVDQVGLS